MVRILTAGVFSAVSKVARVVVSSATSRSSDNDHAIGIVQCLSYAPFVATTQAELRYFQQPAVSWEQANDGAFAVCRGNGRYTHVELNASGF